MAEIDFTKVMMDDSTLDVSKEVAMVMSIANTLRGPYHADKYKDVIIPMIIIRRLECALQIKEHLERQGRRKWQKYMPRIRRHHNRSWSISPVILFTIQVHLH